MKRHPKHKGMGLLVLAAVLVLAVAACAPAATSTPTPTKAPPAASPTTAAPKAEATKPAVTPTAAPSKPTGTAIKIGYLTPLTGPTAAYGQMESIMVFLGEEDVNKTGGINGSPLQVIRYDSPFDPKQAVTLVRKLALDDKAFAILGPFSSGEMDVAAPLANDLQVPVIGMKTTKPGFSENHRPWEFRVTVTDDIMTPALVAAFKKANPNVKKVLIVGDTKEAVTESMVNAVFPKYLKEAGYEVQ
ncbi:MAG TPA: ABC transporter substrate-binding protein, partial [Dehalococcoidia bacterium]|nr:ABC transporter substrate-binding protein [Dehalococcoidia bacterium]